ncbi:DUF3575 domain-containing protein [Neolewinella lacunae]|uniref:DUF3575 domain-containing protein n=1 Tax=Neolewinella lacunae TaxID=1517758 RepID=A0A923TA32_9BACT|nr:DUF3575 domain-containing protein [Neolewinella lacunae]MBC6996146.1 DUF3575 domain-containing protein [Neolewinella lacunae]MDN3633998.1 DUF3575 domain-containing protein [Neolewinella lacunae]
MRIFLFTCLLAALSFTASAQVDAKINVGSLIFGGVDVSADFAVGEKSSFAAGVGYISTDFGSDDFKYSNLRIIPEYRYYLNPRLGADRFFVGAYGKLAFVTAKDETDNSEVDATRGALGFMFGNKWVTEGGFLFELNAGLGRATVFGSNDGDAEFEDAYGTLTSFDFRLGILVGYRF